jgi:BirA family biotin operon repressor/biotin-[acetyl-CoA-carboxylase] ligase
VRPFWVDVNCTLGKTLAVSQPSGAVRGKAINIDDEGALILETADGVQKVLSGDFTITDE